MFFSSFSPTLPYSAGMFWSKSQSTKTQYMFKVPNLSFKMSFWGEFPGSPVLRTPRFHYWGPRVKENKIPSAMWCSQNKSLFFFPVWISTPKSSFYLVVLSQFSFNLYLLTLYWIFLHATRLAEQIRLTAYRICHFLDLSDCDCSLMVLYKLFHHTPHFL